MLVERHASTVFRLAAAIVGEPSAADVTQETFVTAWQQLPGLRHPEAFEAWLRRICVNRARNWLRSEHRRAAHIALEMADTTPSRSADFRASVEARVVLEPAFERLSPDQRAVLALHYSLGYSIAESAEALGVPEGTAKSRLNAALGALRRAVGTLDERPEPEVAS